MRFITLFIFALLAGCQKVPAIPSNKAEKPLVLVSIAPYRSIVEQIAGPDFEVRSVVPMGSNPHSFEPTIQEVSGMEKAKIWFCIGEPFEAKIAPILERRNPEVSVIDLRIGIPLIEADGDLHCRHCGMDHFDRHIWLSPKLAALQADRIAGALKEIFPEQPQFSTNCSALKQALKQLDQEIRVQLEPLKDRSIVVSHPAFGYFCQDYRLQQLSVEHDGKDPRPQQLEQTIQKAIAQGANLALALPQYNNKGAQMIADQLHVPIHLIDPYSADYFATLRKLAQLIAENQHD